MLSFEHQLARARERMDEVHAKLEKLRAIRPSLIDLSLRENAVGARIGQTLADKLELLPKLREFGFRHIVLGTLNYSLPDEPQVDDDFMLYLRDHKIDRTGCFALTDVGIARPQGGFVPSPSLLKLSAYRIPNTLLEIYLSDEGMAGQYNEQTLRDSLPASVAWIRANTVGDQGKAPRIIVNIVDGCDAFAENLPRVVAILRLLAGLPIEGVSLEDGRGTFFPFQFGEFVAIARDILPCSMQLLVHVHAGAGFENASVIEALLKGADGVWAGLPKRTAVNGHASLAELIANLARIGNPSMAEYQLANLLPLASGIQERMDGEAVPDDLPILGNNAYRLPLSAFRQRGDRFMDLPPERIGGTYRYRICPVVSDPCVIAGRLAEITGRDIGSFPPEPLQLMVRLMRRDLRAGQRNAYDEPDQLLALYRRALTQQEREYMLGTPNLTMDDSTAVAASSVDRLIGARPDWWWTGLAPTGRIVALPAPNCASCTRKEVFDYFANGWLLNETLFSGLCGEEAFVRAPYHGLRHPMIFYYGHTATLFVNKLRVAGLLDAAVNDYFERVFEVGVDEMSWDDMSKNEMTWPSVNEVNRYRRQVFELVADLIATHPGLADGHPPVLSDHPLWALFMAMEHERIHFETSSVLIREMPLELLQRPAAWPSLPVTQHEHLGLNAMMPVPAAEITIGKPHAWPSYGWDNEYGSRQAKVEAFSVSQYMITNGQYLEFVKDGGYQSQQFWTENGWKWRAFRNSKWPSFWIAAGPAGLHEYKLRTIFDVVELPLDWPVCVNYHEAKAYLAWRSERDNCNYRLPIEAEHVYLRRGAPGSDGTLVTTDPVMHGGSVDFRESREANLNLAFGSEASVRWTKAGPFGVHDIAGNLWDWCEDDFHALDGFKVHPLYDDFSTPCFGGEHKMILGGSFISTGDEASVWARFHFRPHFFQHAGFHAVAPVHSGANGAVQVHGAGSAKYENKTVMDQYLLFHYGAIDKSLPASMAEIGNFPQRCAAQLVALAQRHGCTFERALDVGCAVGAATFALGRAYGYVTGVDISAQFIEAAESLRRGDSLPYKIAVEGNIRELAVAAAPGDVNRDRIEFRRADACSLPGEYIGFDAVLAGNLLCRLPSPKAFLSRLGGPRGLVKKGGIVVFASPFSWMEQFTAKGAWLGGVEDEDGKHWSADGLQAALGDEFDLVHRQDMPFMIREHRRKFEYVVSDLTVWVRKA